MNSAPTFIAIGENIHCTRIYKVGGKYVKTLETGENVISYLDSGKQMHLPVPDIFVEGEDWKNGKVKHAAVGIWQLLYGDSAAKKAGKSYLQYMARRQENNGASYLDLNVDEFGSDVRERIGAIKEAAAVIQESSGLPLSIDSSNLEILRAGLSACDGNRGKPMVNSVSLSELSVQVRDMLRSCESAVTLRPEGAVGGLASIIWSVAILDGPELHGPALR